MKKNRAKARIYNALFTFKKQCCSISCLCRQKREMKIFQSICYLTRAFRFDKCIFLTRQCGVFYWVDSLLRLFRLLRGELIKCMARKLNQGKHSRICKQKLASKHLLCDSRTINEPCHDIMALFVLRKLILQTRMRSHPVGLDVWFLVGPFVYFHTSCVWTAKALARLCGCAGSSEPSLVAYVISIIISWAGLFISFHYVTRIVCDLLFSCM